MSSCVRVCSYPYFFFFFNDTATTEIYTLSLHDALPISTSPSTPSRCSNAPTTPTRSTTSAPPDSTSTACRSEEHTSELQSRQYLVCRLLLEKKKRNETQCSADNSHMLHPLLTYYVIHRY